MIKELQLGRHRKARIWIDELPDANIRAVSAHKASLPINGTAPNVRFIACELYVPLGPRSLYGLLGCELSPTTGQTSEVTIDEALGDGALFKNSLRGTYEAVNFGLPGEYVPAVINALKGASIIPKTNMRFSCAAHGPISSAPVVFKHLANLLLRLSQLDLSQISDAELVGLFPDKID